MKLPSVAILALLLLFMLSCSHEPFVPETKADVSLENEVHFKSNFQAKSKRLKATKVTEKVKLLYRNSHTSLVFDKKIWVFGGKHNGAITNDILYSENGVDWKAVSSKNVFTKRFGHASAVFNNRMWIVGGKNEQNALNDVWSSADGIHWVLENSDAQFPPRWELAMAQYKGELWISGGSTQLPYQSEAVCCGFNDLWKSADGINWVKLFDISFGPNMFIGHQKTAFKEQLLVVGGNAFGDAGSVNYSTNGNPWTSAQNTVGFLHHSLEVSPNEILWAAAGIVNTNGMLGTTPSNDIWYSSNAINWTKANLTAAFPSRKHHSSVIFNNRLWIIGGVDGFNNDLGDVWSFSHHDFETQIDDVTS